MIVRVIAGPQEMLLRVFVHRDPSSAALAQTERDPHPDDECACQPDRRNQPGHNKTNNLTTADWEIFAVKKLLKRQK